jgi:hypothetical protein
LIGLRPVSIKTTRWKQILLWHPVGNRKRNSG